MVCLHGKVTGLNRISRQILHVTSSRLKARGVSSWTELRFCPSFRDDVFCTGLEVRRPGAIRFVYHHLQWSSAIYYYTPVSTVALGARTCVRLCAFTSCFQKSSRVLWKPLLTVELFQWINRATVVSCAGLSSSSLAGIVGAARFELDEFDSVSGNIVFVEYLNLHLFSEVLFSVE